MCGQRETEKSMRATAWLGLACLGLAACPGPKIYAFRATPRRYCPATRSIHVHWETNGGHVSLASTSGAPDFGSLAGRGDMDIPPQTMVLRLRAEDCFTHSDPNEQRIAEITEPETHVMGDQTLVCLPKEAAVALFRFDPDEFGEDLRVTALANERADRELEVLHMGRRWTIGPGQKVALAPLGPGDPSVQTGHEWTVRAALLPGEVCGTSSAGAVVALSVAATVACASAQTAERSP
jgi:hypothetical protein